MAKARPSAPTPQLGTVELLGQLDDAVEAVQRAQTAQTAAEQKLASVETELAVKTKTAEELRDALQSQIGRILHTPVVESRVRSN